MPGSDSLQLAKVNMLKHHKIFKAAAKNDAYQSQHRIIEIERETTISLLLIISEYYTHTRVQSVLD